MDVLPLIVRLLSAGLFVFAGGSLGYAAWQRYLYPDAPGAEFFLATWQLVVAVVLVIMIEALLRVSERRRNRRQG